MTATHTTTGAVVDFIQCAEFAEFPPEAVTIAKRCIVDGLGVMLAGSTQEAGRILHEHVQGTDARTGSTVFGPKPFKTGSASAALVNGTAGHALDWDDTQLATSADRIFGLLTHPTVPPLVATLAVGEPREQDVGDPRGARSDDRQPASGAAAVLEDAQTAVVVVVELDDDVGLTVAVDQVVERPIQLLMLLLFV